ncbi:MAG TPA: TetR/AcrR family transcriptional regulator [Thermomicrobiales bacterium]|nr:TetR/AcrR family transcriptional regulator [Thermomicrobiales bacterium]
MTEVSAATPTGARERILTESFRRFSELGFAGVSMQQIADAAGVTKATLYHHFQDKEDLFVEVMQSGFARSEAGLAETVNTGQSLGERLTAFATYLFSSERADLNRLFGDFHQHVSPERQAAFWKTYQRPWTYLEGPIKDAIASGEIAPGNPNLIARVCFTAFVGQMQIARFEPDAPPPDAALARQIVDMLLNGLRPQ